MSNLNDEQRALVVEWVEALRSGTYLQGRGSLHDKSSNCFCCVGVVCEVMNLIQYQRNGLVGYGIGISMKTAPRELVEALPAVDFAELYDLNDVEKLSFDVIADHIEEKYLK